MTHFTSIAKGCSILALIVGGSSAVLASISVVLFFRLGGGRECYSDLNGFLNWHALMTVLVLPFAIVAACGGRVRFGALAFGLCVGAWFITFALVANCFHGDRPPPSWKTSQTPKGSSELSDQPLVGNWQVEQEGTLMDFLKDGGMTVKMVDGKTLSGNWAILSASNLQMIFKSDHSVRTQIDTIIFKNENQVVLTNNIGTFVLKRFAMP